MADQITKGEQEKASRLAWVRRQGAQTKGQADADTTTGSPQSGSVGKELAKGVIGAGATATVRGAQGAVSGASSGAAAGSVVPVVGNIVGGVLGAIGGGAIGAGAGAIEGGGSSLKRAARLSFAKNRTAAQEDVPTLETGKKVGSFIIKKVVWTLAIWGLSFIIANLLWILLAGSVLGFVVLIASNV